MSVCPYVKRVNCDKMKESYAHILIPYERAMHLVFRHEEWLVGDVPLLPEILWQNDAPPSKRPNFNRFSLVSRNI